MNERIQKLALDAGLLNYIDNETPRRYFINGHADLEEVKEFAELIVRECIDKIENESAQYAEPVWAFELVNDIKEHFGVE